MKTKYFGSFYSRDDVEYHFEVKIPKSAHLLLAGYFYQNYDGSAYVVYEQGGQLYEVYGSH